MKLKNILVEQQFAFTHIVVASNKGVSIADIDIGTTVYIKLKNQDAYEGR
jgi:hypothetical protein